MLMLAQAPATTMAPEREANYSPLTEINTGNVSSLGLAWSYEAIRVRGSVNGA